jgi:hypothetical protein
VCRISATVAIATVKFTGGPSYAAAP